MYTPTQVTCDAIKYHRLSQNRYKLLYRTGCMRSRHTLYASLLKMHLFAFDFCFVSHVVATTLQKKNVRRINLKPELVINDLIPNCVKGSGGRCQHFFRRISYIPVYNGQISGAKPRRLKEHLLLPPFIPINFSFNNRNL